MFIEQQINILEWFRNSEGSRMWHWWLE